MGGCFLYIAVLYTPKIDRFMTADVICLLFAV
nr:MAG TPA: hypothetical protein [Caudoviricetes sp.]